MLHTTPMTQAIPETLTAFVGSFLAAADASDDTALLLAEPADGRLRELEVTSSTWQALVRAGVVDAWQVMAQGLLGPFEEAWFHEPVLAQFVEVARAAVVDAAVRGALDAIVAFALDAQRRGTPVVFVG